MENIPVPEDVARALTEFLAAAKDVFGADLVSVVLYGSAAEGQLRKTSDVNLLVVVEKFDLSAAQRLSEPFRRAEAAIRLRAMFLLQAEVLAASVAFAVKFADVANRHVLLHGEDVFSAITVPRDVKIFRLKQVLLNVTLRLRQALVRNSAQEERLAILLAEFAAPLRSAAVTLRELENAPAAASPKAALEQVAAELDPALCAVVNTLPAARTGELLPPGAAAPAVSGMIDLGVKMRARVSALESTLR